MGKMLMNKATEMAVAELRELFGPSPVLSSEDQNAYDEITARLTKCYAPVDVMELMWMRQLADATWEIVRYSRHKTLAVDREFRKHREFQVKRAQKLKDRREARADEQAERQSQPATQLDRVMNLSETVDTSIHDVDEILNQPPDELDHARAVEGTFDYLERLDRQIRNAMARQDKALGLLSQYRDDLGARLRKASARIIEMDVGAVAEVFVQDPQLEALLAGEFEAAPSIEAQAAELPQQPSGDGIPIAAPQASPPDGLHTGGPSQAASEGT